MRAVGPVIIAIAAITIAEAVHGAAHLRSPRKENAAVHRKKSTTVLLKSAAVLLVKGVGGAPAGALAALLERGVVTAAAAPVRGVSAGAIEVAPVVAVLATTTTVGTVAGAEVAVLQRAPQRFQLWRLRLQSQQAPLLNLPLPPGQESTGAGPFSSG